MSAQLFGTDGIRGPAGTYPLNDGGMRRIGQAVGSYFAPEGGQVLIGWDPRESSAGLAEKAIEGLMAAGTEVVRVGVIPTPGLAYLTKRRGTRAGVIITASHNPYTDNGVKVFTPDGRKLSDKDQAGLNDLIDSHAGTSAAREGTVTDDTTAIEEYEDFLVGSAESEVFEGLKVALDSANGATSGIAKRVFERLGAEVTPLFDTPDGRNINVKCGATDPAALQKTVKDGALDAGAAFDGDGDRLILVDSKGRQLTGDHILYILALTGGHKGVAATIMSNQGLQTALARHDITLKRTPVGDRSVLAALDETGYRLGGEQSGHIIIADRSLTGDGMLAAVCTLAAAAKAGKSLAAWHEELELLPQALVSIPFPNKELLNSPDVGSYITAWDAKLDGKGRLNVRPSGTEPKLRVMVEAPGAQRIAHEIAEGLTKIAEGAEA